LCESLALKTGLWKVSTSPGESPSGSTSAVASVLACSITWMVCPGVVLAPPVTTAIVKPTAAPTAARASKRRHNRVMRLNAYLARAGIASRRGAEKLIRAGRVTVNGEVAGLATFVEGADRVEVDGDEVTPEPLTYVLLHKPAGVVTTARDPQGRPTVVGLVAHERRVVPVGRLDADTTGVLLLTNDGPLAHRLMHPRYEVDKVYEAEVEGEPDDEALAQLAEGVEVDDGMTALAEVRRLEPSRVELTLHEGRKHQVKRMLAAVGHPVTRLHRSSYAGLDADGLEPGEWRELSVAEVARLRRGREEANA
jgi:23S rRNA pseudouridine2605 synthase